MQRSSLRAVLVATSALTATTLFTTSLTHADQIIAGGGSGGAGGAGTTGPAPGSSGGSGGVGGGGGGADTQAGSHGGDAPTNTPDGGAGDNGGVAGTGATNDLSSASAPSINASASSGGSSGAGGGGSRFYNLPSFIESGSLQLSGGNGGNGFNNVGGGGGGAGVVFFGTSVTLGDQVTITGGQGGAGFGSSGDGGGAGGGGAGVFLFSGGTLTNSGAINGGAGGNASIGLYGGNGGAGLLSNGATVTNNGSITGGTGGYALSSNGPSGTGGSGAELFGGSLTNAAGKTIRGGDGGENAIEDGGIGGTGVVVRSGADATVDNSGVIRGGNGGTTINGFGGNGGTGVEMNGGSSTVFTNQLGAEIHGGDAGTSNVSGRDGTAGAGVVIQTGQFQTLKNFGLIAPGNGTNTSIGVLATVDNSTIINAGTIDGGVTFTGKNGRMELWNGSTITGNVGALGTGAVLALGGADNSTFDVAKIGALFSAAQYQGFSSFEKTGTSTWMLQGTTSLQTDWTISGGTLSISDVASLGSSASQLTFNGGTLRYTGTGDVDVTRTIHWSANGGGFQITNSATTITLEENLDGTGGLKKLGAGTLALAGNNSYSGATTIQQGTLLASSNTALSSHSAFTIDQGATLEINGVASTIQALAGHGAVEMHTNTDNGLPASLQVAGTLSTEFSGVISGDGDVTKGGPGQLILSGDNTYTGATRINDGVLVVDGSLSSSSTVNVNSLGTLSGGGTVGGDVILNSTAKITTSAADKTLTVSGNLSFAAASTYLVQVSPSSASLINVGGFAALNGAKVNANFATAAPGAYIEKQYLILHSDTGIGGTFSTYTTNNLPTSFRSSLSKDSNNNDYYLNLTLDFTPPSGGGSGSGPGAAAPSFNGLNSNQSSAGNAIINFFNSTGHIPMAFGALTPQGLTQVSGEVGTSGQNTTFQANTQFMNVLGDVTSAGRGFTSGGIDAGAGGGAVGYADEAMAYAGNKTSNNPRDAFASFTKAPPSFVQRWSVWAMGFGGSQTTDGNAAIGTNTTSSSIYGAAIGADYRFGPDTVAGFAVAGGGTSYSIVNGGTGRSDLFQAGAFVRQNFGATYLTASAAYGWQDVTTDRYVTVAGIDHLRAEFNTSSYSGRLELGHRFLTPWFGGVGVSPYAAAEVTAFALPSYAERAITGADTFALNYNGETATTTRSELGVRTDKSYALERATLTLRGRAAWSHNFDPDSAVSATFQTLPGASFVVNGARLASDSALTTASAEVTWMNGWSLAGVFEGEFSDVTRSYAGKAVVRYNW
jgi:autotransporter-associated beta strand protein